MSPRCYLDHNATTPLRPEVGEAMIAALALTGNPSSVHAEGRKAWALIEAAREQVARLVHARSDDVIFTSGGSEANALALSPQDGKFAHCYVSAVEHPSVLAGGRFAPCQISPIPVSRDGVIEETALAAALDNHHFEDKDGRPFVSVMVANNETGAIQPVSAIAEMVHAKGGVLHSDAVQAAGKRPVDFAEMGADMLSLSAHKFGGPKGIGALIVQAGIEVEPLIRGGGQERRRRAGTENVAGIVGFGVAAELAAAELDRAALLVSLRDALEDMVLAVAPDAVVMAANTERLPNTSCIAVPGAKAETLVIGLDLAGIAVSSGSACSSGKVEASHVLMAMGLPKETAGSAIRVSLGPGNTRDDIERFTSAFGELIRRLGQSRAAA